MGREGTRTNRDRLGPRCKNKQLRTPVHADTSSESWGLCETLPTSLGADRAGLAARGPVQAQSRKWDATGDEPKDRFT